MVKTYRIIRSLVYRPIRII